MLGIPSGVKPYESLGELLIEAPGAGGASDYVRSLDLATGIARVSYTSGGVHYEREIFASAPANVIVVRFTADRPDSIDLKLTLKRERDARCTADPKNAHTILLTGQIDRKDSTGSQRGLHFAAAACAVADGGLGSNEEWHTHRDGREQRYIVNRWRNGLPRVETGRRRPRRYR